MVDAAMKGSSRFAVAVLLLGCAATAVALVAQRRAILELRARAGEARIEGAARNGSSTQAVEKQRSDVSAAPQRIDTIDAARPSNRAVQEQKRRQFREAVHSSEMQHLAVESMLPATIDLYGRLLAELGLNSQQAQRFATMLARRDLLVGRVRDFPESSAFRQQLAEVEAEIKSSLTPTQYVTYGEYVAALPAHEMIRELRNVLAATGKLLSVEQAGAIRDATTAQLAASELRNIDVEAVLAATRSVLDPSQVDILSAVLNKRRLQELIDHDVPKPEKPTYIDGFIDG